MDKSRLIAARTRVTQIVARYGEVLGQDEPGIARKHGIEQLDALQAAFDEIANADRLLRIGVVGRVKAGKSSLLNALLFDGVSLLPKAATPMTAALTSLTHGDELSAEVEFFTQNDIAAIRASHDQFVRLVDEETRRRLEPREGAGYSPAAPAGDEARERARRSAIRELKQRYASQAVAYEQFIDIQKSGLTIAELGQRATLRAGSNAELLEQMRDYVGSNGRHTPFTRNVRIAMPLDSLLDIEVVDTPGLNDPVVSREERTAEALKRCDVILIVSPAGHFLSAEDLDLMGRIVTKEGVREMLVLASQADTQLFGSEYRGQPLRAVLDDITGKLGGRMVETLGSLKLNQPAVGTTFDALIAQGRERVQHSSSSCYSLARQFEQPAAWDEHQQTVWANLKEAFPDNFPDDPVLARANLEHLGNIEPVRALIANVRQQKERITEERKLALVQAKRTALQAYLGDLVKFVTAEQEHLRSADIGKLEKQKEDLRRETELLEVELETVGRRLSHQLRAELREQLKREIENAFSQSRNRQEAAVSSGTRTVTEEKSGFLAGTARLLWGGGSRERRVDYTKVATNQIHAQIEEFSRGARDEITHLAERIQLDWEQAVRHDLLAVLRRVIGDANLDQVLASRTVNELVHKIKLPPPAVDITIPAGLSARGTLTDNAAEEYLSAAERHMDNLRRGFFSELDDYLNRLEKVLSPGVAVGFVANYGARIDKLEAHIHSRVQVTERLQNLIGELKECEC
ncbi:dynamin family protein [Massilia sp. LMS1-1-1.1]